MAVQTPPIFLQAGSHPAEDVRRANHALLGLRGGIIAPGDLAVTQNGTPNMTVLVATGQVAIPGTEGTYQGVYLAENRGSMSVSLAAADATNPRYDLIVARVRDAAYSGATNSFAIEAVTGTPAASPAEPAIPANSWVLARVTVAALDTTITNADIVDRRTTGTGQFGRASSLGAPIYCTSTTRPTAPFEGMEIYEADTARTCRYKGANWVLMSTNGASTAYTPTLTGITLGTGGVANGFWKVVDGSWLSLRVRITLGTGGVLTGPATISLPAGMTGVTETDGFQIIPAILRDTGTAVYKGHVQLTTGATSFTAYAEGTGGTYTSQTATGSNVPHTWAATDVLAFRGSVEINPFNV